MAHDDQANPDATSTGAPMPADEPERLAALYRYQVLDTPAEPAYDDLASLASLICGTPVALVSLIDSGRQWFKARIGSIGIDAEETPREIAFCSHALLDPTRVLVVPDATLDARFANNPLVTGGPNVRFYAGAPLITHDRRTLGTLCVLDTSPRELGAREQAALQALARQVVAQLEFRQAAMTDGLTRLPNRAAMHQLLQQAVVRARRVPGYHFAVLFMDFDRFKLVNDNHGHGVGDELLRQIADRITRELRGNDAIARMEHVQDRAARIGGDEFVVILDGLGSADDGLAGAERLRDVLSQPYLIGGRAIDSSASIGIVTSGPGGDDADSLLRDADIAMYEAKRAGRGRCVVYDPAMQERVQRGAGLEADLRLALAEGGLYAVYQPIIELAKGRRCVGVEALARWQHPQRGLVPPLEFIPVAEDCGLIGALGEWMLDAACAQFVAWQRALGAAAPLSVSVNLSRAQIQKPGFVPVVQTVLARHAMAATSLQLELTESLAAQDQAVQATLHGLRALGVRLALDDFGTGYSSLACLGELPVNTVKIDRSFVSRAESSEHHRTLIRATLAVARSLGLVSVAEGVETEGQAELLQALGCEQAQGYLFSRPLAAADGSAWLDAWRGGVQAARRDAAS